MAPEATPAAPAAPRRILVAEDEPKIVTSLEFLLKGAGYSVAVARDGGEALRVIPELRPDLVVLDLMLPLVSGFEVCRRIRERQEWDGIRILLLTARGGEQE